MSEGLQHQNDIHSKLEAAFAQYQEEEQKIAELIRQDNVGPDRGPTTRFVRMVMSKINKMGVEKDSPYEELQSFRNAFMEHFGENDARRYRLFHVITSSTPPATSDLYDAEDEWSIVAKFQKLSEKYGIGQVDAEAA